MLGFKKFVGSNAIFPVPTLSFLFFPHYLRNSTRRYTDTKKLSLAEYNERIRELGFVGKYTLAFEQLQNMQDQGLKPNKDTYGQLIFIGAKMKNTQLIGKYFQECKQNAEPDLLVYSKTMLGYIRCGKPKQAVQVFEELKQTKIEINLIAYNTALNAHQKLGNLNEIEKLIAEMKEKGIEADLYTYNIILNSHSSKPNVCDLTFDSLKKMKERSIEPNEVTYNTLINNFSKGKRPDYVEHFYNEMIAKQIKPSTTTFNTMIIGFGSNKQIKKMLEVYQTMKTENVKLDAITYTHLLAGLAECKRDNVLPIFEAIMNEMKENGFTIYSRVYEYYRDILFAAGNPVLAYQIEKKIKESEAKQSTKEVENKIDFNLLRKS